MARRACSQAHLCMRGQENTGEGRERDHSPVGEGKGRGLPSHPQLAELFLGLKWTWLGSEEGCGAKVNSLSFQLHQRCSI